MACGMRVQYTLHALAAKRKSVLCGRRRASERQSAVSTKAGKLGLHSCTTATGTSGGGARGRDGRELQRRTDETLTELIQAVVGQDRLDPAEALPPLRRVLVENLSSTRIRKPSSGVSLQFQKTTRVLSVSPWLVSRRELSAKIVPAVGALNDVTSPFLRFVYYLVGPVA